MWNSATATRIETLPPRLAASYRRTRYAVDGIAFRIGRRDRRLDALLARLGLWRAVLVTAWNPRSRWRPERWNRRAQLPLTRHALASGRSGEGRWREEQALLRDDGRAGTLARRLRQNAVVELRRGCVPRLRQI